MLTKEELQKLAELAKIEITDEELEDFLKDINKILNYVDEIKQLALDNFEPMMIKEDAQLELRPDLAEMTDAETKMLILKQFPEREDNYLKIPKIFEE